MIQNQPANSAHPNQPAAATPVTQQHHQQAPGPGAINPGATNPGATRLGKSVKIIGDLTSDEELFLDGDLEGRLELNNRLTIGPNSKVSANIRAQEIIVFGTIKGNVESESRVSLRTGASIVGDIKTAGIVIEDGAYFKGGIDISRGGEGMKTAPKSQGASAGQKR